MECIYIIIKTSIYYFLLTFIFRIMGKREVGQLGTFDLVVFVLIAELVAMGIENKDKFLIMFIPIFLLVFIQMLVSKISLKSSKFRHLVDGKPTVIIKKGIIDVKNMIKQRYTLDDLLLQLRQNDVKSIDEVSYALLENNGKLSVFKKDKDDLYPLPLIIDGKIDYDNLKDINKDENWIMNILYRQNIELKNVFYAFNKKNELYIIKKSELL